jgi:signal transduction histidine kinase
MQFITDHPNKEVKQRLFTYYNIMSEGTFGDINDSIGSDKHLAFLDHLNNGYIHYLRSGEIGDAFRSFRKAINLAEKKEEIILLCEAAKGILGIYERFVYSVNEETFMDFLDLHKKYAYDNYEKEFNSLYEYRIKFRSLNDRPDVEIIKDYENANKNISNSFKDITTKLFITNCTYHLSFAKQIDSSYYFLQKAEKSSEGRQGYLVQEDRLSIQIYDAIIMDQRGETEQAIDNLENIQIDLNNGFVFRLSSMYRNFQLSELFNALGKDNISKKYKDLFQESKVYRQDVMNRETIFDIEESSKVKEAEQRLINAIYFTIVLTILLFITALFLKNSHKKRLIAVQERELENQKNLNLLKEQEISTINAMVEGQEKERQLVAEDLHDNLGSALATIKLHIENLRQSLNKKKVDPEKLLDKAEDLIEEAYQKVRSIAHAKNSGVIANEGLLVAIKLMAEKVSAANSIEIDVIHFGLEKRLENSFEISLFRIIQELTTNIIKHANAKHATINISQDEEGITLLVEDDGVGMKTSQIKSIQGMGLRSIKTRVEHLNGTFTIDSTPTKGATMIIQIPVQDIY